MNIDWRVLEHPNVRAFSYLIRAGESSAEDVNAYRALYGWKPGREANTFSDFSAHPRTAFLSPYGFTSAAGAYQAMAAVPGKVKTDTWGDFQDACGTHNFSPASQDRFYLWCVVRRGALQALLDGDIRKAMYLCRHEWASLPDSPYGQPVRTHEQALATYKKFWGAPYVHPPVPIAAPVEPSRPPAEALPEAPQEPSPIKPTIGSIAMDVLTTVATAATGGTPGILLAAFNAITDVVPKVLDLFKGDSKVAQRNVEAVKTIVAAAKTATNAVNEQDLIEKIQSGNPAVVQDVEAAVRSVYYDIEVKLDGVAAARAAFLPKVTDGTPFWKTAPFWVTMVLMVPIYFVTYNVMVNNAPENRDLKLMVATAWISGALFGIMGFWLGTSMSSQRKTELAAAQQQTQG